MYVSDEALFLIGWEDMNTLTSGHRVFAPIEACRVRLCGEDVRGRAVKNSDDGLCELIGHDSCGWCFDWLGDCFLRRQCTE